jgi:hypothetical protein
MKLSETIRLLAETDQMFRPDDYGRPLVNHPERRKTVCVDFDGVLAHVQGPYTHGYIGRPRVEGLKFLRMLLDEGFTPIILTARKETDLVATWLGTHGFKNMMVTNEKPPALMYVDDHARMWHDKQKAEDVMKDVRKASR